MWTVLTPQHVVVPAAVLFWTIIVHNTPQNDKRTDNRTFLVRQFSTLL